MLTQDDAAQRAAYWLVPVFRAVPAAVLAIVITFSADHSAHFGLLVFGVYGITAGAVLAALTWARLAGTTVRRYFLAQSGVTMICGIFSLVAVGGGVRYLFLIVTFFAAITGLLELYSGIRTRRRFVASGDWRTAGILTLIVAVILLVLPPEYSQTFRGPDGVTRVLDSSVVVVGVMGAYAAVLAVYLLIAGFSAKWGTQLPSGGLSGPILSGPISSGLTTTETSSNNSPSESETSL